MRAHRVDGRSNGEQTVVLKDDSLLVAQAISDRSGFLRCRHVGISTDLYNEQSNMTDLR